MPSAPMLRRALTGSLLTVLAGPLLATMPSAVADETPAPAGEYVALGDSFAAGPQILPMQTTGPVTCARSTKNFASVLSTGLDAATFVDATCSGAKLTDLWQPQGEAPPQLEAITPDTTLITFGTLGGNDVGLVGLATQCVLGDCAGTPDDANHQKVEATRAVMSQGVEDAKAAAPGATIVMVGYGTYLPPGGCPGTLPLTAEEADYLQGLIDHLSDVIGEVAAAEGVLFADQREIPGRLDHTVCAPFDEQWIRGINTGDGTDGAMLHPSAAGMRATAELIAGVTGIALPPEAPTTDELLDRARSAMNTVGFRATCKAGEATLRVRRGQHLVNRVVFKVGRHAMKADKQAPYRVTRRAGALARFDGRPKAVVRVKVGSVELTRTFRTSRPGCLRG
ncbi:SGNH/GDSL hydrolase family protein [Nocardioides sp. JQ2195]|uniref:SGNH/GDSL hydrolase family protein n=1 Tax=Nocardioides sp. JQ2195 TaxID=2592334 RepID=UPI00143E9C23|nr:SGNH/GDSL hydrolase family protein [Nocardioides sp. JQ2195]QIX28346.1 SGNH/GDSL hydrolase family protein [Nocardioides sp. JQ2195]